MTNPDSSSPIHQAKGPTRLQLQSACVKAGLDSTPGNDDLKKALQKHWDENNQAERFPLEVDDVHEANETNNTDVAIATTTTSIEITSTTVTTSSTEDTKSQDNSEDGPADKELEAEEIAVKLEVKLEASTEQDIVVKEESVVQEAAKNDSESAPYPTASATSEVTQVEKEVLVAEAMETTIKQEEDAPVKEEEAHSEEKSLLQPKVEYDDDIKPEDIPAVPVSERAQFWESKASTTSTTTTSTPRSNLPVSKTRLASGQRSQPSKPPQKRKSEEDTEVKQEGADNTKAESPSSSLPTPGTVRKMIGRFATSGSKRSPAAEPPVAPMSPSKKRRIDSPATASSSTPTPGSSAPGSSTPTPTTPSKLSTLKNKVVKIPVATASSKAKNVYATPRAVGTPTIKKSTTPTPKASEAGKAVAIRRQKAIVEAASEGRPRRTSARLAAAPLASSSTTSTSTLTSTTTTTTTTTSSKSVSAETINRLATPKKVNTSTLASTTTPVSFAVSVGPATPTRPRGPILSTASRAAQRSHRKKD